MLANTCIIGSRTRRKLRIIKSRLSRTVTRRQKHAFFQLYTNLARWSSICRGATLWGLEHSQRAQERKIPPTVKSRIARYSYGIRMDMPFDSTKHTELDRAPDSSGRNVAKDQMFWLLEKVSSPKPGEIMELTYGPFLRVTGWKTGAM